MTCVSTLPWTHSFGQILASSRTLKLLTERTMANSIVLVLSTTEMVLVLVTIKMATKILITLI